VLAHREPNPSNSSVVHARKHGVPMLVLLSQGSGRLLLSCTLYIYQIPFPSSYDSRGVTYRLLSIKRTLHAMQILQSSQWVLRGGSRELPKLVLSDIVQSPRVPSYQNVTGSWSLYAPSGGPGCEAWHWHMSGWGHQGVRGRAKGAGACRHSCCQLQSSA
jgi:hypothetical protein